MSSKVLWAAAVVVAGVVASVVIHTWDDPPPIKGETPAAYMGDLKTKPPAGPTPAGMVWVAGGVFKMGSSDPNPLFADAKPVHGVAVTGFWMDEHEVTNAGFAEFVKATGYKTLAEKPIDKAELMAKLPPGSPEPPAEFLAPGSLVFTPPNGPVPLNQPANWWAVVPGACWNHPEGPASDIKGRETHPVVHVCWEDAVAYCKWAGKRLPTEAEWEYAARGGLDQKPFSWGDEEPEAGGVCRCNKWQGEFPHRNSQQDGHARTAPVKSFKPNGFGLYDTAGNVWEWCSDWYHPEYYDTSPPKNPRGPDASLDPNEANPLVPKRVQRGGSFLCSEAYCSRYKPYGRGKGDPKTGQSHVGFRCVKDAE